MNEERAKTPKILLYGPPFGKVIGKGYGGGTGGYTRNMETYLSSLELGEHTMEPLFHTVRGERSGIAESFPARMLVDSLRIIKALVERKPDAIHVLASYRTALWRELVLTILCKVFGVKLLYDIKAGEFIKAYERGSVLYKKVITFIMFTADDFLVEGEIYQDFIDKKVW